MAVVRTAHTNRYFDFRLALGIPLALMALLLLLDPSGVDFALANRFYEPGLGFVGRHNFWLEDILHDRAKQGVIILGVLSIGGLLLSLVVKQWRAWSLPLGYLVLSLAVSTSIVTPLKKLTAMQCPWSLTEFGGEEAFSPLLGERAVTDHPGRCWPGGHASAGFSLIALFFALRDRYPRRARVALALALGLGMIFSIGRVMQGAHFLSHNLWTLLFDWLICTLFYRWLLYRPSAVCDASPAQLPVHPWRSDAL